MAISATIFRIELTLSDVDRGVYETLDLRLACHPSETLRYMLTRTLAYALSYEEGIAFSKGGLSSTDEPPVAIHDPTGVLLAWIDVGEPKAERLHKASKAAKRVVLFSLADLKKLQSDASARPIHKVEAIEVWRIDPKFLDALEPHIAKHTKLELTRNDGNLYATVHGTLVEGRLEQASLVPQVL